MSKHKKILTAALCAAMMLSATACNRASNQMAETFIVCDTIADTEEMVGYYTMLPETIEGHDTRALGVSREGGIVQGLYLDDGDGEICIRKAIGDTDISGDTNSYPEESTIQVLHFDATVKGSDGKVNVATWKQFGWTYSITSNKGLDKAAMVSLISYVRDEAIVC